MPENPRLADSQDTSDHESNEAQTEAATSLKKCSLFPPPSSCLDLDEMEPVKSVKESGWNSTVDSTGVSVSGASVDGVVAAQAAEYQRAVQLAQEKLNVLLQTVYTAPSSRDNLSHCGDLFSDARKLMQGLEILENLSGLVGFQDTSGHESNEALTDHEEVHKAPSLPLAGKHSLLFPSSWLDLDEMELEKFIRKSVGNGTFFSTSGFKALKKRLFVKYQASFQAYILHSQSIADYSESKVDHCNVDDMAPREFVKESVVRNSNLLDSYSDCEAADRVHRVKQNYKLSLELAEEEWSMLLQYLCAQTSLGDQLALMLMQWLESTMSGNSAGGVSDNKCLVEISEDEAQKKEEKKDTQEFKGTFKDYYIAARQKSEEKKDVMLSKKYSVCKNISQELIDYMKSFLNESAHQSHSYLPYHAPIQGKQNSSSKIYFAQRNKDTRPILHQGSQNGPSTDNQLHDSQLTSKSKRRSRSPPSSEGPSNTSTHSSTHSSAGGGGSLPSHEASPSNLNEDVTSSLHGKEEEEGSVEVSTNSLADPQSTVPSDLNTTSSDKVATDQKLVPRHLDTTILPPSPTGDVRTTTSSSTASTMGAVQPTMPSSNSTGSVIPIAPPPPPLKGGKFCLAQQETAHENGNESNAKMIVGHFSNLPKDAVGPTGGNEVQPMGKPFYFGQNVLVYSSVAFVPVSAHEDFEGSNNRIAVVSDQKMDRKETARGRLTLEADEYIAQLYEQMKDKMEPPPPEGKIIFSTCAEFTEGSMLPLPSAAAMADTIGKGGNGVVSYVYHNNKEFAVKETCLREEELRTLSKLSGQASRNVLPISAVMEGPPLDRYHGRRACYQLMPRATGDVRQMLDRSGSSTLCHYFFKYKQEPAKSSCVLANTRVVLRQALRGLQHLHSKGIVHRDVKLQNILLDMRCGCGDVFLCPHEGRDSYRVYLADFDSALDVERARGKLEERARKGSVLRFTPHGTQGYRAPETSFFYCSNQVRSLEPLSLATRMVLGSALTPYLNPAQDLWSFGCTVLKLFVGVTGPTSQKKVASVLLADCLRRSTQSSSRYQHSVHGRLTVEDEEMMKLLKVSSVKKYFPLAVKLQGLIRQCLQVDPHLRPSAEQCEFLPFFKIDPATDKKSYPSEPRQDTPAVKLPYPTRVGEETSSHHRDGNNESVKSPKSSNGGNTGPPSSTPPVPFPKGDASSPNAKVSKMLKKQKEDDGRLQVVMLEGMQDEEKNRDWDLRDILRPVSDHCEKTPTPKSSHGGQSKSSSSEIPKGRDNDCKSFKWNRRPDGMSQ